MLGLRLSRQELTTCDGALRVHATWGRRMLTLGIVAVTLLIYASLVPLNYQPMDWSQTIQRWESIPWLKLGVYSRSDWIANGLVVVPAGFLLTGALRYGRGDRKWFARLFDLCASALVLVFLVALVLGIELVQVWFPPRTVSRNDILAGWIGALAGILCWHISGMWLIGTVGRFVSKSTADERIRICVGMTCLASILHTFFPFDIILTWGELKEKIAMERIDWIPKFNSVFDFWSWKGIFNESVKMAFWGIWIGLERNPKRPYLKIFSIVLLLELAQIPIYSRNFSLSQIVFGFLAGLSGLVLTRSRQSWGGARLWAPRFWIVISMLWAALLFIAFTQRYDRVVTDPSEISERFREFFLPPFTRYYYTSEYRAASSIMAKSLLFGSFGMMLGMIRVTSDFCFRSKTFNSIALASIISIALAIEATQIFLAPAYSDSTDVLIATISGIMGFKGIEHILTPTTTSH
jgi:VanZ family protein